MLVSRAGVQKLVRSVPERFSAGQLGMQALLCTYFATGRYDLQVWAAWVQ